MAPPNIRIRGVRQTLPKGKTYVLASPKGSGRAKAVAIDDLSFVNALKQAGVGGGSGLTNVIDGSILANISGVTAKPIANTLTAIIDHVLGTAQGDILYRNASGWVVLAPGTSGNFLQTQGAGANPAWASAAANIQTLLDGIGSTRGAVLYRGASGWAILAPGTSGFFLKSNGVGADPSYAAASAPPLTNAHIFVGNVSNVATDVAMSGDATIANTGAVTIKTDVALAGNPTTTTQATTDNSTRISTTAYVTTAIANAIAAVDPAIAVDIATTAAADTSALTYNNGAGGIGATLTGTVSTPITIDGHTLVLGDRVLVKNDTQSPSGAFNGIYYVSVVNGLGIAPVLTRVLDYDTPSNMNNTGAIPVKSGTANALTSWLMTSTVVTVGTTPLTYVQFSFVPVSAANPTATGSDTAVNGSAATYMRSDAAFAIQLCSSSQFGLVKPDGTTITTAGGVASAVAGGTTGADIARFLSSPANIGFDTLMDPLGQITFSNSNKTATPASGTPYNYAYGCPARYTGKRYFEFDPGSTSFEAVGVCGPAGHVLDLKASIGNFGKWYPGQMGWSSDGKISVIGDNNGTGGNIQTVTTLATWSAGNRLSIAIDIDNLLIWFRVTSGNWNNNASANPATGTLGINCAVIISGAATALCWPGCNMGNTSASKMYLLAADFTQSVPSGFTAWGA